MKTQVISKNGRTIGVVDNVLSNTELDKIWLELNFLTDKNKMLSEQYTNAARDNAGNMKKKNWGLPLSRCFTEPVYSNFAQVNEKPLTDDFIEDLISHNLYYRLLKDCKHQSILLSYYEDTHFYKSHHDVCCLTTLFWFHKKNEKQFSGGDIYFDDLEETIEFKNNRFIIFPSIYLHEVTQIQMEDKNIGDVSHGSGRYCYTTFYKHG